MVNYTATHNYQISRLTHTPIFRIDQLQITVWNLKRNRSGFISCTCVLEPAKRLLKPSKNTACPLQRAFSRLPSAAYLWLFKGKLTLELQSGWKFCSWYVIIFSFNWNSSSDQLLISDTRDVDKVYGVEKTVQHRRSPRHLDTASHHREVSTGSLASQW